MFVLQRARASPLLVWLWLPAQSSIRRAHIGPKWCARCPPNSARRPEGACFSSVTSPHVRRRECNGASAGVALRPTRGTLISGPTMACVHSNSSTSSRLTSAYTCAKRRTSSALRPHVACCSFCHREVQAHRASLLFGICHAKSARSTATRCSSTCKCQPFRLTRIRLTLSGTATTSCSPATTTSRAALIVDRAA